MKAAPTLSPAFLQPAGGKLPEPLLTLRQQRGKALVDMPLPTRKTENWKYSSRHLKLTEELANSLPSGRKAGPGLALDHPHILIHNGVVVPEASDFPELDGIEISSFADLDDDTAGQLAERLDNTLDNQAIQMARLNAARFEDGLYIRLKPGAVLEEPLYVIIETDAGASGSAYPRLYVDVGANSQMTLVEEYISSGDDAALVDSVTEFSLGEGANLTSIRLSLEGDSVQHIGATGARLLGHARLDSHTVGFGGPLRRHDLQVRLEQPGAECRLNGVAVSQGKQHYDNHTTIEHVAPHCNSEETYRNIAADESHIVFNGRIHIHEDAQKSAADMNNKNLLLTTGAEIDAKPELEIYADDVTCAHGATIGQLDDRSLFYLVSRGISRQHANTLLTMAFINELVEQIPVEAVRQTTQARLNQFIEQAFEEA
ncbi:iron-regulated ABC transporter permease protein SufD [Tamilnaduibacter salinus]|uniref:Iron-regulated ABC transporter permease protein SufD n=1 Tax=Tamilnaduibacter salinus TaxID=1484056 RepID=A0A2U1CVV7_9GAMM|nr:Fe-S cluster assembly protein SufD [Tamilnaduibacter salinus]PVY75864.1 iron-regulated ABC transporter permease protein SufD [Tamilnaduibacter salinus]